MSDIDRRRYYLTDGCPGTVQGAYYHESAMREVVVAYWDEHEQTHDIESFVEAEGLDCAVCNLLYHYKELLDG